ncbi:MAG TPA: RNase H family protein [Actinomycetota bacterium]|nr:RNase H family protein [Actinomycetota bacterium]
MTTTVYTDGACIGNPGPGGWAWAIQDGAYASGAAPNTTNQRMELTASLEAIRAIEGPLLVISDSKYVVDCFGQRWYDGWERRGWTTAGKKPVVNQDLWRPLIAEFHRRKGQVRFTWVKGHAGNAMNDVVDRLATEAAATQVGRSGSEPPTSLGLPDLPRSHLGPSSKVALPEGWRVVVLGHRPPELGGYDPTNPVAADVRRRLVDIIGGLAAIHPDVLVVTGLGLGAEQLGAEAALEAGVPYAAVLAYPDPEALWPAASRAMYSDLVAAARATVVLSPKKPASKQEAGMGIGRRNDWLIERADAAVVVWDGRDSRLGATVAALHRLDPGDLWIVEP